MKDRARAFGRRALSRHTTVVAYLALVLASSGVAYAAATVGTADVVNNSLKSIDLKDGYAVKGVDVVDDSLTGADIQEGTLVGVDAATVDGVEAADLVRGEGRASAARVFIDPGESAVIFPIDAAGVNALYQCPANLTDQGYFYVSHPEHYFRLFIDGGGSDPTYRELWPGSDVGGAYMNPGADHATVQVALSSGGFVTTFEVFSAHLSNTCYVHAQAVFTALP